MAKYSVDRGFHEQLIRYGDTLGFGDGGLGLGVALDEALGPDIDLGSPGLRQPDGEKCQLTVATCQVERHTDALHHPFQSFGAGPIIRKRQGQLFAGQIDPRPIIDRGDHGDQNCSVLDLRQQLDAVVELGHELVKGRVERSGRSGGRRRCPCGGGRWCHTGGRRPRANAIKRRTTPGSRNLFSESLNSHFERSTYTLAGPVGYWHCLEG